MKHTYIDVADVLRETGAEKRFKASEAIQKVGKNSHAVELASGVEYDVLIRNVGDALQAQGSLGASLRLTCSRCLEDFEMRLDLEIEDFFSENAPEGDTYPINGETINLGPVIEEELLLAMPAKPLCEEGCRGLCATCGANLNETDCGHQQGDLNVKLEALKDWFAK